MLKGAEHENIQNKKRQEGKIKDWRSYSNLLCSLLHKPNCSESKKLSKRATQEQKATCLKDGNKPS